MILLLISVGHAFPLCLGIVNKLLCYIRPVYIPSLAPSSVRRTIFLPWRNGACAKDSQIFRAHPDAKLHLLLFIFLNFWSWHSPFHVSLLRPFPPCTSSCLKECYRFPKSWVCLRPCLLITVLLCKFTMLLCSLFLSFSSPTHNPIPTPALAIQTKTHHKLFCWIHHQQILPC